MINLQAQVVYFPTNVFVGNVICRWLNTDGYDGTERKGKEAPTKRDGG